MDLDRRHSTFSPGLAASGSEPSPGHRHPLPPPIGAAYPSEVIDARPRIASRWEGELPAGIAHMSFDERPAISTRRRLVYMRLAILIALGASALLTVDLIRPGRAFCPLEQACAAASASVLGSIMGIPTAILGLGSFAVLLLVTFFPTTLARRLLLPAGLFAGGVGLWLLVYQIFFLGSLCPLCVVVDTMALVLGALILTWESPAWSHLRWQDRENHAVAMAWLMVAALVVLAPFAWPRNEDPAWEQITPLTEADFADVPEDMPTEDLAPREGATGYSTSEDGATEGTTTAGNRAMEVAAPPVVATRDHPTVPPPQRVNDAPHVAVSVASAAAPAPRVPEQPTPADAVAPTAPAASAAPEAVAAASNAPTPPTAAEAPARIEPKPILIVEYLNAYCRHCRATHKRLEAVLEELDAPVRRRRIYTWSSKEDPLWARACFFAREHKRENAMFRELMKASAETPAEIFAAAERAGLDTRAMQRYLAQEVPPPALLRNRRLMRSARLKGLPTFDIGRRRLLGEQSKQELRAALEAARPRLRN